MALAESPLPGAVVFTGRSDILSVIRSELKDSHIEPILCPEGVDRCIEELVQNPGALLILDWQIGVSKCVEVLEAVRSPFRMEIRPIFIFSQESDVQLEGIAIEYGVIQIHVGEITKNVIHENLREVVKTEGMPHEVREGFKMVAESRERGDWSTSGSLLQALKDKYASVDRLSVDLCENLFYEGKLEEAKDLLAPLCEKKPPDPRALNILGRIQLAESDIQGATVTLQKAKVINPFNIDRLISLGESYLQINMVDRAERNFREAVDHGSKDPKAVGGLGKSLLMGEKINEALVFLKQLSGPREMASVFNSAAVLSMRSGRFVEGMKLYHVAVDAIGKQPEVVSKLAFNMGIGFHRSGDNQKAMTCFGLAVHLDERNAKAKDNFEKFSKHLGKPDIPEDHELLYAMIKQINITGEPSSPSQGTKQIPDDIQMDDDSEVPA